MTAPAEGPVTVTLTDEIMQALTEHQPVKHHTTIEGFKTCACSCGILTECAGPMGWFVCEKGHAEHLARDVLAPIVAARVAASRPRWAQRIHDRAEAAERVIANVRALADKWLCPGSCNGDTHAEGYCFSASLRALLPAAPTGEDQS
jgi:hypothetical protein